MSKAKKNSPTIANTPTQASENPHLALQQDLQKLDRALWVMLPTFGVLLGFLFANYTRFSTIMTVVVFTAALIAVGIKKYSLTITVLICSVFCFVDNYISYQYQFNITGLKRQALTMILFVSAVGLARPMIERALFKKHQLQIEH